MFCYLTVDACLTMDGRMTGFKSCNANIIFSLVNFTSYIKVQNLFIPRKKSENIIWSCSWWEIVVESIFDGVLWKLNDRISSGGVKKDEFWQTPTAGGLKGGKKLMTPVGFEPTVSWSEVRRLIHWAMEPGESRWIEEPFCTRISSHKLQ